MTSRGHYSDGVPFDGDALIAVGAGAVPGPIDLVVKARATNSNITMGVRIPFLLQDKR